ncbi:hypothetical protein PTTG_28516 [Puccinia triticina 1-1 BBBD Race 1]|uniref:Uncharacterized protein n=2 Tax=Puccinia triticina TaxID=208348 RepID=A0A180GB31_PUCT1|nr:uncharacterized protein PtA15_2A701 [Puccinia triticina]OAV89860.1 hypothetical protein PTTG_28516 [Puccinia triticina 1-1 BBBD Race 1]WAQ82384.1 hypothetical protein PtA15_2A701 [Puccinia triticina]WAR53239.1 hypothetical protein PtB15_2B670 [Puccinia triticina]
MAVQLAFPPQSYDQDQLRTLTMLAVLQAESRLWKSVFGAYVCDAMTERQTPDDIYDSILEWAYNKLLGPTGNTEPGILTKARALAALHCSVPPSSHGSINGALHLNTEQIASHAANCDYISPGCV